MKRISTSRLKAKVRQYRIRKHKAKSSMTEGNVNVYIKDLISLYNSRTQLKQTMISIPVQSK